MPYKIAGKLVMSNIASARNQWYSKDSDFWLAQNDVVHYGVTLIPTFLSGTRRHLKRSVDTLIGVVTTGLPTTTREHHGNCASYYCENGVLGWLKGFVKIGELPKGHNKHGHYSFNGGGECTALYTQKNDIHCWNVNCGFYLVEKPAFGMRNRKEHNK